MRLRVFIVLLLPCALWLTGCVSKGKAQAQARAAFLAGQQQAMQRMQQQQAQVQGPSVSFNGQVHNAVIPWTPGLDLGKAIVAADYYGPAEPDQIFVVRNGVAIRIDPNKLLRGEEIPLQPGDLIYMQPTPIRNP